MAHTTHVPTSDRPADSLPSVALGGILMGAADIVPGVSGGTVALLLGIYERLVANIRRGAGAIGALLRGDVAQVRTRLDEIEWAWLLSLLAGIGLAIVALASAIEHQLEVNPIPMSALFLGLVAGSTVIASRDVGAWSPRLVAGAALAAVLTFALLGLKPALVVAPSLLQFAGAGAIAICAMILPGVSGSFLLLTMGMYEPLLDAAQERDLFSVAAFLAGATAGLAAFSTALSHALERWHDQLLAVLIGLMIGSIRVLWPWPAVEGVGDTRLGAPDGQVLVSLLLAVVGFAVVLAVAGVARRRLA